MTLPVSRVSKKDVIVINFYMAFFTCDQLDNEKVSSELLKSLHVIAFAINKT
ncbi:hypothetical protein ACT3S9_05660 [Pseudoalteromonas sp. AOP31-A2-14]|uniref:hypothetical protein n=1 Tax=Pseudoalteromonas sp. AOP31-A2-14 TaxID=3457695 RepID=UPI0040359EF9